MPMAFRLDADWSPDRGASGRLTLTLSNTGDVAVADFVLAVSGHFRIRPEGAIAGARLVAQLSGYHEFAPEPECGLAPGETWSVTTEALDYRLNHYTDGPGSAAVRLADGTLVVAEVTPMTRDRRAGMPRLGQPERGALPSGTAPVSIIPWPAELAVAGRRQPPAALSLAAGSEFAKAGFEAVAALAGRLFPDEVLLAAGGLPVAVVRDRSQPAGGYALAFAERVTLAAADDAGIRHGFITLAQMLRGARAHPEDFVFPAGGHVVDWPRFAWRGAHLDVARQVYGLEALTGFLDVMAWNKLNRFHIHLNDDEGWRLDVPAYPALAARAAFRGPGELLPPLLGSPFARYGIVYRAADVAAMVAHGAALGIEIIPEIDIPGHCHCVLEALPDLRDPGETGTYHSVQYFPNNALNPALEESYAFLAAVVETLVGLFPSPWIHIGGDEVADGAWSGSPRAQALGEPDTPALQSRLLRRVQTMLREHGRQTGAWEEAAQGGGVAATDCYLVAWKAAASGRALAEQGYDVVLAPAEHCYLDMAQSEDWWAPGASWAGTVPLAACYGFDPALDWPAPLTARLKGVQCCLWSETVTDRARFDHLVHPRLSALAETAWTPRAGKDFNRFLAIQPLMPRRPA